VKSKIDVREVPAERVMVTIVTRDGGMTVKIASTRSILMGIVK